MADWAARGPTTLGVGRKAALAAECAFVPGCRACCQALVSFLSLMMSPYLSLYRPRTPALVSLHSNCVMLHSNNMVSQLVMLWWTPWPQQVWRKGFICLPLSHCCSSPKKGRTGTQAGPCPGGRGWYRGPGGVLLTDLLIIPCSVCFLLEPRTTFQGWPHPQ